MAQNAAKKAEENPIGRWIVSRCAEKALEGNESCVRLMDIFAVGSRKSGHGDIIRKYRAEIRRRRRDD